jgi:hypothetical protein
MAYFDESILTAPAHPDDEEEEGGDTPPTP